MARFDTGYQLTMTDTSRQSLTQQRWSLPTNQRATNGLIQSWKLARRLAPALWGGVVGWTSPEATAQTINAGSLD